MIIRGSGGGGTYTILPRTTITLNLVSSATTDIVLAKYVDTTMWVSGNVLVRVFARTLAANQFFDVVLLDTSCAEEDPAIDFTGDTLANARVSSTLPTSVPGLVKGAISGSPAPTSRVILRVTQSSSGGSMSVTMGVDLTGRPS
jgi:hypothetical protein